MLWHWNVSEVGPNRCLSDALLRLHGRLVDERCAIRRTLICPEGAAGNDLAVACVDMSLVSLIRRPTCQAMRALAGEVAVGT